MGISELSSYDQCNRIVDQNFLDSWKLAQIVTWDMMEPPPEETKFQWRLRCVCPTPRPYAQPYVSVNTCGAIIIMEVVVCSLLFLDAN